MDRARLRATYDKQFSSRHKDHVWELLDEQGYVDEVVDGFLAPAGFCKKARKFDGFLWRVTGSAKPTGRTPHVISLEPMLTESEVEHAAALAPYLARRAALLPEVIAFRDEKLGGGPLEPKQVAVFLRGELQRLSSEDQTDFEVAIDLIPSRPSHDRTQALMDLVGGWENRSWESKLRHFDEPPRTAPFVNTMAINLETFGALFIYGLMDLICDEMGDTLEDHARRLTARYPWPLRDAAWFMLTGEPPEIESLKIEHGEAGRYGLAFAPWISEKTLRRAYRRLRDGDGDNRPLTRKSLSAFQFVDEHTHPGRTPKWSELTDHWNRIHPDDEQFADRSALRRAYKRAEKRLTFPWANYGDTR